MGRPYAYGTVLYICKKNYVPYAYAWDVPWADIRIWGRTCVCVLCIVVVVVMVTADDVTVGGDRDNKECSWN